MATAVRPLSGTPGFTASRIPVAPGSVHATYPAERYGRWVVPIARVVALVADDTLRAETTVACSRPWQLPSDLNVSGGVRDNCCVLTPPDRGAGRLTSRLCDALWRQY